MRQIIYIAIIAVVAVLSIGCTKEKDAPGEQSISQITATYVESQVKTVLAEDGTSVLWSPNDEISVHFNGVKVKFTSINGEPASWTTFQSSTALLFGGSEGIEKPYIYSIYPYSEDNAQHNDTLSLTVPSVQTAVAGSFGRGCYPSVGRSVNTEMAFYNVCGGLRFSVTHEGITDVVFKSLDGTPIAGKVNLAFEGNIPTVQKVIEGQDSIILSAPAKSTFETGKWYYIAALPGILSSGFRITFKTEKQSAVLESSSNVTIKRGIFGSLTNADDGLEYKDSYCQAHKVLLLYADGYNNLPAYMEDDINDLSQTAPQKCLRDRYSMLVLKHFTQKNYDYKTPNSPLLLEFYKDGDGTLVIDTLKVYPDTMVTSSISGLRAVLSDVKDLYPAAEYGLIYSSHGTGWIPVGYYDSQTFSSISSVGIRQSTGYCDLMHEPLFKSLGCQAYYQGSELRTMEIDVRFLQDAFPMHFKYLILDACLMGGIETAYQLRDVVDKIIFSANEIIAGGFDYLNLPNRVLYPVTPDYKSVCDDYMNMYNAGTIALVDCAFLEALAGACIPLFETYSDAIAKLKAEDVQGFGRYQGGEAHPWYFDLRDILIKAGASLTELYELDAALANCVEYKLNAGTFLNLQISTYCGLSMYLPSMGNDFLDNYYKGYEWNKSVSLVK